MNDSKIGLEKSYESDTLSLAISSLGKFEAVLTSTLDYDQEERLEEEVVDQNETDNYYDDADEEYENVSVKSEDVSTRKMSDDIFSDKFKHIILKYKVSTILTEEILNLLNDYGIRIPTSKRALVSPKTFDFNKSIENELILQKLSRLEDNLNEIKMNETKILDLLNKKKDENDLVDDVIFPVSTLEDLLHINEMAADKIYASQLVEMIKPFKPISTDPTKNKNYGLSRIMSDSILVQFNWDGSQGKKSLKQLRNINDVLFEAWKGNIIDTYHDYLSFIRGQLHLVRARWNQQVFRSRKRKFKEEKEIF